MNIYEMLDFIRKHDTSVGKSFTRTADFLNGQYAMGRVEAEDLFYMYQDIMITMITCLSYGKESGV